MIMMTFSYQVNNSVSSFNLLWSESLVTEKEIINGILSAKDANERTLCFFREIVDIHEHLTDGKASKYIDMVSETEIDQEAEKYLPIT